MRSLLLGLLLGTLGPVLVVVLRGRLRNEGAEGQSAAAAAVGGERSTREPSHGTRAEPDDLSDLTAAELYRRAQAAGIAGRSGMTKAQLIAALRAVNRI
jgi:hypothetical protein